MGHGRAVFVAIMLVAGQARAAEVTPAMVWTGAAPSGACKGDRVVAALSTGTIYCCTSSTWGACGSVSTATALAADPANCGAGQAPLGVTASGAVEGCFTPTGTYTLPDATAGVTGGVRLTGDLGGTATSPSVVDNSHAHDGTTISALDAGDTTTGTFVSARLPIATSALGAVKMAAACGAGNHVASIDGTGELTCTADSGGGGGYATVQDEGGALTTRTILNFAGAGVACADDTTRTTCTISGGGGGGLTLPQVLAATHNSFGGF